MFRGFGLFFMFGKKKKRTIDFLQGHHNMASLAESLHLHLQTKRPHPIRKILKYFGIFLLAVFIIF